MIVMQSVMEVAFFPCVFFAMGFGFWLGLVVAMNDEKRALYWRRRAKSAEGQLLSAQKSAQRANAGVSSDE